MVQALQSGYQDTHIKPFLGFGVSTPCIQRSVKLTVTHSGVPKSCSVQVSDAISQQKVTVVLKVLFRLEFIDTQVLTGSTKYVMLSIIDMWKRGKIRKLKKKSHSRQALLMLVIFKLRIVFCLIINRFQNCVVYKDVNISHLIFTASLILEVSIY